MKYIDVHAHYDDECFLQDIDKVLEKIQNVGVEYVINAGSTFEASKRALEIATCHKNIYCTLGIHPEIISEIDKVEELEKIYLDNMNSKKIVAIGEIGLDYHGENITDEIKEKQIKLFEKQLLLAKKLNLPVQIHSRDAVEDMLKVLNKEEILPPKIMFHCYELNIELTKIILKRGYSVSLGGNITYKRKIDAIEQIQKIPLNKIMLETDCPYLAPTPVRGTRNDSSNLIYVARKLSEIKQVTLEEVVNATYNNAVEFYGLK